MGSSKNWKKSIKHGSTVKNSAGASFKEGHSVLEWVDALILAEGTTTPKRPADGGGGHSRGSFKKPRKQVGGGLRYAARGGC